MSIQSDFEAYTNKMGFVSDSPGGSSGNDLLISAEAKRILLQNNVLITGSASNWALDLWDAIEKYSLLANDTYARPGWTQDQEQPDDYYGLAYISPFIANNILHHGRDNWWLFKTSPAAKYYETWFWRWPALICHVKWAAGFKPNYLLRLWWAASVAFSGSSTNLDPWKINRLLIEIAGDKGWLERLATKRFWKRLAKTYGNMKNVYSHYYGPEHPITKYCLD